VIAQEGCPLLASWLVGANRPHILLNGSLAHPKAQFQQLPMNALSTPEPIVYRHLPDQSDGFRGYLRLVGRGLGFSLPIQTEELPMPARASCLVARPTGPAAKFELA